MANNNKKRGSAKAGKAVKVAFKQDWSIGKASAEADQQLLDACFVDTGALEQLIDTDSNASIVLGRVGAGKSALLSQIESQNKRVSRIDPSLFSIKYICNSSALEFVSELGVKLDPLFQALWKHVLCVEYIRIRFNIKSEKDASSVWTQITNYFPANDVKRLAYDYFREFGGVEFWQTTEVRLKEIDQKLERQITTDLNISSDIIKAGAKGARSLTESQRVEVVNNAKTFISNIHMAALQNVVSALAEMDEGNNGTKYFIVIDDLDTEWADTEVRHRLIRALIESIRRFRPIRQLKIVVAMRVDLLESVVETTRDAGLQLEKLEDFFLRLSWTDQELKQLIDLRINHALKSKYTRAKLEFYDIFPREVRQKATLDYILEKTLKRPRDAILFVNECFKAASGRTEMTPILVQEAYRNYSASRRLSILEEWNDVYPDLKDHLEFVSGWKSRTQFKDISIHQINKQLLKYLGKDISKDSVSMSMVKLVNAKGDVSAAYEASVQLQKLLYALFAVGAVGLIFPPANHVVWAGSQFGGMSETAIDLETVIVIHPMLANALGVNVNA